jgi:hypothetical protein
VVGVHVSPPSLVGDTDFHIASTIPFFVVPKHLDAKSSHNLELVTESL